jgi:hypothetical protein
MLHCYSFRVTQTALFPNGKLNSVIEGNIEGRIEVAGRRGKRPRKLQNDIQERRGYCKLKKEARDLTLWRTRFGRGCGLVEGRQQNE